MPNFSAARTKPTLPQIKEEETCWYTVWPASTEVSLQSVMLLLR